MIDWICVTDYVARKDDMMGVFSSSFKDINDKKLVYRQNLNTYIAIKV